MEFMTGLKQSKQVRLVTFRKRNQGNVKINGYNSYRYRHMGEVPFIVLRKREGLVQCVLGRCNRFVLRI
jgi:aspartyl-tRNA synthetase